MMNKYLFIIPATPKKFSNKSRIELQELCILHLLSQSYANWEVLWISENSPNTDDKRFIHINYEGPKEEKLQIATKYIKENNVSVDYIIRLDDDDLFNTKILDEVKNDSFDLMVDKHQTFWLYKTNYFASRVWYWFPNTCIHKAEHALSVYGTLANEEVKQLNSEIRLIENDHSKLHYFYTGKKIVFAPKSNPIYLRTITNSSITYNNSADKNLYFSKFGTWQKRTLNSFFIPPSDKTIPFSQTFFQKGRNFKNDIISNINYQKIVLSK